MDQTGLLHVADYAHDSGDRDCALDLDYLATSMAGKVRQAQANRAMDAAIVVLRMRDRCNRLSDGLSDLCRKEQLRQER